MKIQKFKRLNDTLKNLEGQMEELENAYADYKKRDDTLHARQKNALASKGKGNTTLGMAIAALLIGIILLIVGSEVALYILILGGILLAVGAFQKMSGKQECKRHLGRYGTEEALEEAIATNSERMDDIDKKIDAKMDEIQSVEEKIENLVAYKGRKWNFANTKITSENIHIIERDVVDMIFYLAYTEDKIDLTTLWIMPPLGILNLFDPQKQEERKRYYQNLKDANSWVLLVCREICRLFDVSLLGAAKEGLTGEKEKPLTLADDLTELGLRKATTELELELLDLLEPLSKGYFKGSHFGDMNKFR